MSLVLLAQSAPTQAAPAPDLSSASPLLLAVLLGALTLLPFVLLVGTSFVKISVVLAVLRNGLGLPQVPSNAVLTGLALVLTLHAMGPTIDAISHDAGPHLGPALRSNPSSPEGANALSRLWTSAREPLRRFLRANAAPRDRAMFYELSQRTRRQQQSQPAATQRVVQADDLEVLLPAFLISELTRALMIGFLLLLPFLIVDLIVATVLSSVQFGTLSAGTVSLPFKLLLFVSLDGWFVVSRALLLGYR